MNFNTGALAKAAVLATSVVFCLCSLGMALWPDMVMTLMGYMVHLDPNEVKWKLDWTSFALGLLGWAATAAAGGWLLGWFYNKMGPNRG